MDIRFAVATREGNPVFSFHEGAEITVAQVNEGKITVTATAAADPTARPDQIARQLVSLGVEIVLAGGMHPPLLDRLNRSRINVVTGAAGESVAELVTKFIGGAGVTPSHTDAHRPAG